MQMTSRIVLALLLTASSAQAAEFELKNDGFDVSNPTSVGVQLGFVPGEIGAVRLDPPSAMTTYALTGVTFLFAGATTSHTITLHVWQDTGATAPGTEIFSGDYAVTGANDALQSIDLSADGVTFTGSIRVGVELTHAGVPSLARDDDGSIAMSHNFLLASGLGWIASWVAGLTGDWVIRATVDDGGTVVLPDAGAVGSPDAGTAGDPDAGTGTTCMVHSECPTGQYCGSNQMCTYDCRVASDCGDGMRCTSLGMCEQDSDGDGGGCRVGAEDRTSSYWILLVVAVIGSRWRRRRY